MIKSQIHEGRNDFAMGLIAKYQNPPGSFESLVYYGVNLGMHVSVFHPSDQLLFPLCNF